MRVAPWNQYKLADQETDYDNQLASDKKRHVCRCLPHACFGRSTSGLKCSSPRKVGPAEHQEVLLEIAPPNKENSLDLVKVAQAEHREVLPEIAPSDKENDLPYSLDLVEVGPAEHQEVLPEIAPSDKENDLPYSLDLVEVCPAEHQEVLPEIAPSDKEDDLPYSLDLVNQENNIEEVTIKSCLKKPKNSISEIAPSDMENDLPYSFDLVNQENTIEEVTLKSCLKKPKNSIQVTCTSDEDREVSCDKDNDCGLKTERRKVQWVDKHGGKLVEILGQEPRKSTCVPMSCLHLRRTWSFPLFAQYRSSFSFPWIAVKYPTKRLLRANSIKEMTIAMVTNRVEQSNIAKMMADPMMILTMCMYIVSLSFYNILLCTHDSVPNRKLHQILLTKSLPQLAT